MSAAAAAWAPLGARAPLPRAAPPGGRPDGGRRAQASLPEPKTKLLAGALQRWGAPEGGSVLLIVDELTERVQLASRNLAKLEVNTVAKLNGYDILRADRIILERSALRHIQVRRAGLHPQAPGRAWGLCPARPARWSAPGLMCACVPSRGARVQEFYGGERGEDEEEPASASAGVAEAAAAETAEAAPAEAAEAAPAEAAEPPAEAPAEAPGTEPAAGA